MGSSRKFRRKKDKVNGCQQIQVRVNHDKNIATQVQSEMALLLLAFLRIRRDYGKKRLIRFFHEFDDFCRDMYKMETRIGEIKEMLLDECNFDIDSECRKILEARVS